MSNSFSSGFGAGLGLGQVREMQRRTQIMQQQTDEQIKQNLLDAYQKSVADSVNLLSNAAPKVAAEIKLAMDAGNLKQAQQKRSVWEMTRKNILDSTLALSKKGMKQGLFGPDQVNNVMDQIRISAQLQDPAAQKQLETDIATQGAIETEAGKQPYAIQRIQETGRQTRLTKAMPQRVQTEEIGQDQLANPAISQIYGFHDATVGELKAKNIFIPEDKSLLRGLIPARVSHNEVGFNASKALQILERSPDVASLGDAAEWADKIRTVSLDMARAMNMTVTAMPNSEEIDDAVRELAGENRELASIMISMAYASAIAKGQTGTSLSDKDIVNEIRAVGGNARTASGRRRALMGFVERAESGYRDRIASTLNRPPPKTPYLMNYDELLNYVNMFGGWESMPEDDQAVVRARFEYLDVDENE
jgi:hypothetical protein